MSTLAPAKARVQVGTRFERGTSRPTATHPEHLATPRLQLVQPGRPHHNQGRGVAVCSCGAGVSPACAFKETNYPSTMRECATLAGVKAGKSNLTRELKRLFRSMSFVSRHPSLSRRGPQAERFAEIYQQLGMLWEFLALQCRHTEGWRKTRERKLACKLCGTIRGVTERWVLLPRDGRKTIGRKLFPNSGETFPNKKAATIVDDSIDFHGATLNVDVHNSYRSRLFQRSKLDLSVAAERIVRVEEGDIECWLAAVLSRGGGACALGCRGDKTTRGSWRTDHGLPNGRRQGGQADMACVRVFFEQDKELLTIFWQEPRADQICTELDDGVILIKDSRSGEPIGIELLAYRPGDDRFDSVHVDVGRLKRDVQPSART